MPPFPLSGRFPSASVPQGSYWWIYVGRLVLLLVPPAPLALLEEATSPWGRAPLGWLMPGFRGPLTAAVRLWQRASGCALPGSLLAGMLMPLKVLAAPWWP